MKHKIENLIAQSTKHFYNVKWNQIGGEVTIKVDSAFYQINWFNNKNTPLCYQSNITDALKTEGIKFWIVKRPASVLEAICQLKGYKGGALWQLLKGLSELDKLMVSALVAHLPESAAGVKEVRDYKI